MLLKREESLYPIMESTGAGSQLQGGSLLFHLETEGGGESFSYHMTLPSEKELTPSCMLHCAYLTVQEEILAVILWTQPKIIYLEWQDTTDDELFFFLNCCLSVKKKSIRIL